MPQPPQAFASELLGNKRVTRRACYINLAAQHNAVEIAVEQLPRRQHPRIARGRRCDWGSLVDVHAVRAVVLDRTAVALAAKPGRRIGDVARRREHHLKSIRHGDGARLVAVQCGGRQGLRLNPLLGNRRRRENAESERR